MGKFSPRISFPVRARKGESGRPCNVPWAPRFGTAQARDKQIDRRTTQREHRPQ